MLELWLQQKGGSFETLGIAIADEAEVQAALQRSARRTSESPVGHRIVSKNLIFRLNHQEPGWLPSTEVAQLVQAAILRRTGLTLFHLQNSLPNTGSYSCRVSIRNTKQASDRKA